MMRVLVVDDDDTLVTMLELLLPAEGIQVDSAYSGSSALAKLEKNGYDAILLDLRMSPMSGIEFLEKYKGSVPVVVMTGGHDEVLEPFRRFPAFRALLYKPRSLQPFLEAINYAVRGQDGPRLIEETDVPPVDIRGMTGNVSQSELDLDLEEEDSDRGRATASNGV